MGDFRPFESKMSAEGLPEVAIRTFRHYYEQLVSGEQGTLSRAEIGPVDEVPSADDPVFGDADPARFRTLFQHLMSQAQP